MNSRHALLTFLMLASGACSLHKVEAPPPPDFVPESFTQQGNAVLADEWWMVFDDEQLNSLMATALSENRSLRGAWARLEAAEAGLRIATGTRLPSVDANTSVSRSKSQFFGVNRTSSLYSLGISAAYELDVWHRLSARQQAAVSDRDAAASDGETVALMLTASIANTYYVATEQQQQLALLDEQEKVNQQFLEIIEARFGAGQATAVDVYQQREQLAAIQVQVPAARQRLARSEHLLSTLCGRPPGLGMVDAAKILPALPPLPATGLPIDLLERRPDVRAARARLVAQDHRLGAAMADRYPSLRFSVSTGASSVSVSDIFSNWVWSLAGNVVAPIFDGGRRKAEVDRNHAVLAQLLAAYEDTVLTGLREVEDALVVEVEQQELLARLAKQQELADAAYGSGRARYLEGVGNFLTVLTELSASQRIQRTRLSAHQALISNRISLYQALGATPMGAHNEDGQVPSGDPQ